MRKKGLDERQRQIVAGVGAVSFYIMFGVCAAVIVIQLIFRGNLQEVVGETIVFVAGGVACLTGTLKHGIWAKSDAKISLGQNLLGSVICSGMFSVFLAMALSKKVSDGAKIARYTGIFFLVITLVCFACLLIMGKAAQGKREKQEKMYEE